MIRVGEEKLRMPRSRTSGLGSKGPSGSERWLGSGQQEQQVHRHPAASKPESCDTGHPLRAPGRWKSQGHCPSAQRAMLKGKRHVKTQTQFSSAQPKTSQWVGQGAWLLTPRAQPVSLRWQRPQHVLFYLKASPSPSCPCAHIFRVSPF